MTPKNDQPVQLSGWRLKWYNIIFSADTTAGRRFDLLLIWLILLSVAVVMIDSVHGLDGAYRPVFLGFEWVFTLVFTAEYLARLVCNPAPMRYALSFFGLIDLISVLPTYLALFFPEVYALVDVRVLRLLRIFRVLKLAEYVQEYQTLGLALAASRRKVMVFLSAVLMVVVVMGTVMYVVEGPQNGFTSIPTAIYWAITTMTTVGFGDITPKTDLGRFISSIMMLLGWGTLAVPTGIVTAEMTQRRKPLEPTTRTCHVCLTEGHRADPLYCRHCGHRLPEYLHESEAD